jgi:hypothetical protein
MGERRTRMKKEEEMKRERMKEDRKERTQKN